MDIPFAHLHTHSHYSIGRATASVRSLVERAAALGMPALALTDHNSVAGLNELSLCAEEFDIQPIIGCELSILPSDHGAYQGRVYRLIVLVANETGYRNLVRLITRAHEKPDGIPPHVTFTDFERQCEGLLALTGSRRGELYYWLREKKTTETRNYLNRLAAAVGRENLYFEIMEYPHPLTRRIMDQILELSRFLHIPAVATQNVHFLDPGDMPAYCASIQRERLAAPYWPLQPSETPTRHFTSPQEMRMRFGFTPQLLEESWRVAQRCEFEFPRRRTRLPAPSFERGQDAPSLLWDRAIRGATERYGQLTEPIKERLNEEYGDLCGMGDRQVDLSAYLLVLSDIMEFLRLEDICRGVGRGPLATSVIAYALGIVQTDPLAYGLDYCQARPTPDRYPVFDLEVSSQGMERTLDFLRQQYGRDRVAAIGKRVDWDRQSLFESLSKWSGLQAVALREFPPTDPPARIKRTHKKTPAVRAESLEKTPQTPWDEDVETRVEDATGYSTWVDDPRIPRGERLASHKALARVVHTLHPCPRGFEIDRGQFALSRDPIDTLAPVVGALTAGRKVTQANAAAIDRMGIPRIRFASFAMLNILETAREWVRQESDARFSLLDIPFDDESTFRLLGMGLTNGITPLHSITAKSLLRTRAPRTMRQLVEVHALAGKRRRTESDAEGENQSLAKSLPDCVLSYWCAYLKARHPVSFMAAMLTHASDQRAAKATTSRRPRFQILLREARKMEIEVLAPQINFSAFEFSQEGDKIRTGLMTVGGMGQRTYAEIERVRQGHPFTNLADFCQRTDSNHVKQGVVVNLIKAGVFDDSTTNRAQLLLEFERALKKARGRSVPKDTSCEAAKSTEQLQIFEPWMFDQKHRGSGAPPEMGEAIECPEPTRRDIIRFEREALGYSITHDLLDYYDELMGSMGTISPFELSNCPEGNTVYVTGFIDHTERDGALIDEKTEMVLDLEGYVVKASPATAAEATRVVAAGRGPALIEGVVEKHGKSECFLTATRFYSLEEVARRADDVAELHLNIEGQTRRRIGRLRSLLKSFPGPTRVVVAGRESLGWFGARGIDKLSIFFCPPLARNLRLLLPETRIKALDRAGRKIEL